jgi:hypothetical protein
MGWDKQILQWDLEKALRENEDLQNAISNLTGQILIRPDGESTLGENPKKDQPEQAVN